MRFRSMAGGIYEMASGREVDEDAKVIQIYEGTAQIHEAGHCPPVTSGDRKDFFLRKRRKDKERVGVDQ